MSDVGAQPITPDRVACHHLAAFAQAVSVMKPGRHRFSSPVVLPTTRARPRARRSPGDELLGKAALEAPMPGSLLVLLSRLHRSEDARPDDGKTSAG